MSASEPNENPFALSIGDLMAALLLIFVLLLSATLLLVKEGEEKTVTLVSEYEALQDSLSAQLLLAEENEEKTLALISEYEALQDSLYQDLLSEFEDDLVRWSATIDRQTLSVRFSEPDVLFEKGSDVVRGRFRRILNSFFPRYVRVLRQKRYIDNIVEIRIEGHTSSEWSERATEQVAYFKNMELSQDRTRSVLRYAVGTLRPRRVRSWTRDLVTANGLSSSQPVFQANGREDARASRRVEFRVRTDAEAQLKDILDGLKPSRGAAAHRTRP